MLQTYTFKYTRVLLLGASLWLGACATTKSSMPIRRTLGGVEHVGVFVTPSSYEWYIRGELAFERQDYATAVQAFRVALATPDPDPYLFSRLAMALHKMGNRTQAQEALAEAELIDENSGAVWNTRAVLAEEDGLIQEAIQYYRRALAVEPANGQEVMRLVYLLRSLGQEAEADAVLQALIRKESPWSAQAARARLELALRANDSRAAANAAKDLVRLAPAQSDVIKNTVRTALEHNDISAAYSLMKQIAFTPEDAPLWVDVYRAVNNTEGIERVLAITPHENFGGVVPVAKLYLAIGRPAQAEEIVSLALVDENPHEAYVVYADALRAQGKLAEAAEAYATIPKHAPLFERACLSLADIMQAQHLKAQSAELLGSCIAQQTTADNTTLRIRLAEARLELGRLDGALLALGPIENVRILATRARLLELGDQLDAAHRIYVRLNETDASLDTSTQLRIRVEKAVAQRNFSLAIRLLKAQLKSTPEQPVLAVRLAESYAENGDNSRAEQQAKLTLAKPLAPALRARLTRLLNPK